MYCLRCGRETDENQAFCLDCQKDMEKYPVDPNAVVQLPVRRQFVPKKAAKRRIPPEEQVKVLKRRARILTALFLTALIVAVCLSIPMIRRFGNHKFQIGQNYTTVKPTIEPTGADGLPE